jgi:hypothetical protein
MSNNKDFFDLTNFDWSAPSKFGPFSKGLIPSPGFNSQRKKDDDNSLDNTDNNVANNTADDYIQIPTKISDYGAGFPLDFQQSLGLPEGITSLEQAAASMIPDTINKSWDLYKEKQLTDLRGTISKELAQLYNATEIGKTKIAAQGAMDLQRQTGADNYRNALTQSYSTILANM